MPRVAMDFSKTVIYHFVCQDEMIKCSYVGSTTNIIKRKATHKASCNIETSKGYHYQVYQSIRDNGGWDNWKMVPLEEFPCENKTQQVIREQYWIDKLHPEMNSRSAYQPDDILVYKHKWYEANKDISLKKQKERYEANKDIILEKQKERYEANKDIILEKQKGYYQLNKEKKLEYQKQYKEANRDKINQQRRKPQLAPNS